MASIFIVADEENLHGVYNTLFELRGHKVIGCAFDGDEAVQLFLQLNPKPDVIIMDHRMPRMDGISATKMIHEISEKVRLFSSVRMRRFVKRLLKLVRICSKLNQFVLLPFLK